MRGQEKENIQAVGSEKPACSRYAFPSLIARCFQDESNGFCLLPFSSSFRVRACCQEDIGGGTLPQRCAGNATPPSSRHSPGLRRSSAHEQIHGRQGRAESARPGSSAGGKTAGVCRGQECPAVPPRTLVPVCTERQIIQNSYVQGLILLGRVRKIRLTCLV